MPVPAAGPVVAGVRRTFAPAATLFALAPLIGEVLFGALPLSQLPFGLLGLIGLYGGGALLVREAARRSGLSAWRIVALGMAYGIFEEGTVVQSLFDQHYRGLDFLGFYGHWAGVNWVWSLFIVPYHAVFSITIPIALVELLYPSQRREAWLGGGWQIATGAIFGLNAVLLAVFQTHLFTPRAPDVSLAANLVALVVIVLLITAAIRAPSPYVGPDFSRARSRASRADLNAPDRPAASRRQLWWVGFGSGLGWFVGYRALVIGTGTNMPAGAALGVGVLIAVAIVWIVARVAPPRRPWSAESTYALVAGALPTCWLLGFLIAAVSGGNPAVNLAGHVVFGVLMFLGLRAVRRGALASGRPDRAPPKSGGDSARSDEE
jgi:hypothetical protein